MGPTEAYIIYAQVAWEQDLCAYTSKMSGNSRHGYTMVYNIMQPIYDNDTMASEQKGDVYNPMKL